MTYASGVGNINKTVDYTKMLEQMYAQQQAKTTQGTVATNPVTTSNTVAEDTYVSSKQSTETCTDGKDDGKIGFWSAVGNTVKGVGKTLVNGVKGMFTNKDGKFSLGKTLASVGTAALCIAFPAVGLVACAVGGVMGAVQVGKGIYNAATADTDAEAKQAWQDIGGGAFTVATSAVGAKASLGAVKASSTANVAKTGSALDEATTMSQKAVALVKDMGSSTVNRGRTIGQTASAFVKQGKLTKANKKVEGLEKKIANAADDADTTKLQKKLESAKEAKAKAQEAYDTSNGKTNVEKIELKVSEKTEKVKAKLSEKADVKKAQKAKKNVDNAEKKLNGLDETDKNYQKYADKFDDAAEKYYETDVNARNKALEIEKSNAAKKAKYSKENISDTLKEMPSSIRDSLSNKAQKAWDILTTKGKYEAIKELGYDAVYEVLAVVEGYSLAEQSV